MPRNKSLLKLPEQPRPLHRLPEELRDSLINVALVGCGGNGAQMLTKLARLDYALRETGKPGLTVVTFDPDTVSRANIGRQLFAPSDIGQYKATVLVNRLNGFYGLEWWAVPEKYKGCLPGPWSGSITAPDLLVTCVDSAKARREIFKMFSSHYVGGPRYWLDMGNAKLTGQVILGQPAECRLLQTGSISTQQFVEGKRELPRLPHVVDVFPDLLNTHLKEDNAPSCSLADALDKQSLFVNDALTSHAAQLLDSLLRIGEISYHGVFINLETGRTNALPIPADCATPAQEPTQEPIRQRVRVRAA